MPEVKYRYITLEEACEIHRKTVDYSGGGLVQSRELGTLDGALKNIQIDSYYPTIVDKLTHLFFCVCEFHCFADGNKRLAITLCTQFLLLNGYLNIARDFIPKMENISYYVAAGKISKNLLHQIMESVMDGSFDENESLQLSILDAIK